MKLHSHRSRSILAAGLPLLFAGLTMCAYAQGGEADSAKPTDPAVAPQSAPTPAAQTPAPPPVVQDKRVFGVFPNYRTTENSIPFAPITPKQKFLIGFKDSFDWPVYPTAAAFAVIYQLENQNPSFGQGMKGYSERFATSLSDQIVGNIMTEGVMPSLLHEDPRYFRLGTGGVWHRAGYALTRVIVCRTDTGSRTFNFSEWLGNSAMAGIGNAYYPDGRTLGGNAQRLGIAVLTDAISQVGKEFWPDVKRRLFQRHQANASLISTSVH